MKRKLIEEAINELSTLRDIVRWGVSQFEAADLFFGHGTDNAWDEAMALVLHAIHLPPDINPEVINSRLTTSERQAAIAYITRRVEERIPAPYLTHVAWFAHMDFYVDQRVLVPRSPIAELIEQGFQPWLQDKVVHRILDLCTGSGCIAIASATYLPEVKVDAVDISVDALAVAKMNVERHGMEKQVRLMQSDLFAGIGQQRYDIIISNPPYVDVADMIALPDEYRHEPNLGLAAGEDGLDFAIKILYEASKHLTDDGLLIMEVGNSEQAMIQRYPNVPFIWLEFTRGGQGVFILTAEQLKRHQKDFSPHVR